MEAGPAVARFAMLGTAFWAAGVLSVHALAALGGFARPYAAPLLCLTLPAAWLAARCGRRLLRLSPTHLVAGIALLSAPALLLDGVVLTWAPRLYVADPTDQRAAAAWLLWFVGVTIVLAVIMARRPSGPASHQG
jgi:hypothetical protein